MANCNDCGKDFVPAKGQGSSCCGPCIYERYRFKRLEWKYGITEEQYTKMHDEQHGCCAICGIHESKLAKRLHVDHCHDTGAIRGLLCRKCNTYIAHFEKEPGRLLEAYRYLGGQ